MPGPWQALYFASKAFVLSFSQAVGQECADSGVRIMVAAPRLVETQFHSAMKTRWFGISGFFRATCQASWRKYCGTVS